MCINNFVLAYAHNLNHKSNIILSLMKHDNHVFIILKYLLRNHNMQIWITHSLRNIKSTNIIGPSFGHAKAINYCPVAYA